MSIPENVRVICNLFGKGSFKIASLTALLRSKTGESRKFEKCVVGEIGRGCVI